MYIENWESFYQQAELLYKANPLRTRHSIKYRHCDGKLVIKVTDDNTVSAGLVWEASLGWATPALPGPLPVAGRRPAPWPHMPQCLQYRTDQQADLKKLEKLNTLFLALMATGEDPPGGLGVGEMAGMRCMPGLGRGPAGAADPFTLPMAQRKRLQARTGGPRQDTERGSSRGEKADLPAEPAVPVTSGPGVSPGRCFAALPRDTVFPSFASLLACDVCERGGGPGGFRAVEARPAVEDGEGHWLGGDSRFPPVPRGSAWMPVSPWPSG